MKYDGVEIVSEPTFDTFDDSRSSTYMLNAETTARLCAVGWRTIQRGSFVEIVPPAKTLRDRRGRIRGWLAVDGTVDKR